jgi:hypothetical protein
MAAAAPPPAGYEAISSGDDERIGPHGIKAGGAGFVLAYVWGEWRPARVKRRTKRGVTVSYPGPDGNTWTGGEQRVAPERVAVRTPGAKFVHDPEKRD